MARAGYACEVPEEGRYGHGQVVLVTVGGLLTVETKDTREVVLLEASPTSRNWAPPSAPAVTESTADPCHYWQLVVIAFALTDWHDTRSGVWPMDVYRSSLDQGGNPPPSVAACRAEVQRLMAFRDFAAAPQLRNFLRYIVEETLAQRGDQLKERNIAVHALMRDADFDPRLDCIVRVMAGKLRRALECHYQGIDGASAEVRIEVPRGTYRPVFRRIELASREAASSRAIISAQRSQATGARPVLAVLPLLPLTEGREELALAEALACEVCVLLRQLSWLELLDYLVTRRWQNDPHGSAAEEMHCCDYIVGGTCRRQAGQFRVTVQLTNVCDGHLLWADQFDLLASMENFAAEDAIVTRICAAISQSLRAAVPIDNPQHAQSRLARRGVQSDAKSPAIVKALPP